MDFSELVPSMATPESNEFPRSRGFGFEDSGYLSNTPDSGGLHRYNSTIGTLDAIAVRSNLANSGLYTPDITSAATKKRFPKCSFKKYKSFPVTAFECQGEDVQPQHDGWSMDEDESLMPVEPLGDPNTDNFSMYETRNAINEDSMDVADYFPDSFDLAAEDEHYNDCVIETVQSQSKSISVSSELGMQLLHTKLTAVQLASQSKPEPPPLTWRNQYGHNSRKVIANMCGKKTVDFFSFLAIHSDHTHIVGKILGYLSPKDLNAIAMTCHNYNTVVGTNVKANRRRYDYITSQMDVKENAQQTKQRPIHMGNIALSEIANLMIAPVPKPMTSPPVTPSKRRFHSFVRAGLGVKPGDHQTACPLCGRPATVDATTNGGRCGGQSCGHEFCAVCRRLMHSESPCLVLGSPQAKKSRVTVPVGSKRSKKNLRRL